MATEKPSLTKTDAEYQFTLENDLSWRIFSEISLGAAAALWQWVEIGHSISALEAPQVLAGTWPLKKPLYGGVLVRWSIPFMFLSGLGIECLLKSIRIIQMKKAGKPVTCTDKGGLALAKELKTHDLKTLATKAGISLDEAETQLLERLTDFVEWAGRYPIGASAEKTPKQAGAYFVTDKEQVLAFVKRLRAICDAIDPHKEVYRKFEAELYGEENGPESGGLVE